MLFQLLFGMGRSVTFTVHEGPDRPTDRMDRADGLRFVKDGFIFPAFLLGLLWLIGQRLWTAAALYAVALVAILLANAMGLPDTAAITMVVGLNLWLGFEGDRLERAALEQKGWTSLGTVTGTNALDCERRFFDLWLPGQPVFQTPITPTGSLPPLANRGSASAAGRLATLWRGQRA